MPDYTIPELPTTVSDPQGDDYLVLYDSSGAVTGKLLLSSILNPGGSTGQVLLKDSANPYDTSWGDVDSSQGNAVLQRRVSATYESIISSPYTVSLTDAHSNSISGLSIVSGAVSVPPGRYRVLISCPIFTNRNNYAKLALWDDTSDALHAESPTHRDHSTTVWNTSNLILDTFINVASTTVFSIRIYAKSLGSTFARIGNTDPSLAISDDGLHVAASVSIHDIG